MITQDDIRKRISDGRVSARAELVARYGDRYEEYRRQFEAAGRFEYEPTFPLYLMLEQSYQCNLRCPMCIQGLADREAFLPGTLRMPRPLFDQVVLEGEMYGCPSIAMHVNDEPLMVKDIADRIAFARQHGFMEVFVTTNGLLFTPDKVRDVIEAGATHILFSLDAATPETYAQVRLGGTFEKALAAVRMVREYRDSRGSALPVLRASFVQNRVNESEIAAFQELFDPLVDYVEVQGFSGYYDRTNHLIPSNATRVTDFTCNEPWRKLIIRANGDVLPCCTFYGYEIVLGNLASATLSELFNDAPMREMRREFAEGRYRGEPCSTCSKSFYNPSLSKTLA